MKINGDFAGIILGSKAETYPESIEPYSRYSAIENLGIQGTNLPEDTNCIGLLITDGAALSRFEQVTVIQCYNGIEIRGPEELGTWGFLFERCFVAFNHNIGIFINGTDDRVLDVTFQTCTIQDNVEKNVAVNTGKNISFSECNFDVRTSVGATQKYAVSIDT